MYRNIFQTTKIASLAMAMTALISCNKEDNNSNTPAPTPPSGQVEENFNVIYRVGHERNSDWAILPLSQEKMTSGKINFQSNGFVLPLVLYFLRHVHNRCMLLIMEGKFLYMMQEQRK